MDIKYRNNPIDKDLLIRVATDYNSGMLVEDMVKRYNISRQTIYKYLKLAEKTI